MIRLAGNMGTFYPAQCDDINKMIKHWNKIIDEALSDKSILDKKPKAIIVPHAGYIYSGFTANIAYRILANSNPKRVVVIGPSHHVYFEGISAAMQDNYQTPCGNLPIDKEYIKRLSKLYPLHFIPEAHHKEHSTETQMPFLFHYTPHIKVIEIIYGKIDYKELIPLIETILNDPDNAVVISSDLSHFYSLEEAQKLDRVCLAGVAQESVEILERGCEACGIIGIKAIIELAKRHGWKTQLLDYRTSADASGDSNRVVGYMSAIILEN